MSEKQTKCPECLSTYKVTVPQLTAAQGMVCCPKCEATFNAISYLTSTLSDSNETISYQENRPDQHINNEDISYTPLLATNVLDIFEQKVENSNINLKTYLNNLNAFNPEPISAFPTLNLAKDADFNPEKKNTTRYYTIWGIINFSLIAIFVLQIVMINPKMLNNNSLINSAYTKICGMFQCESLIEQYKLVDFVNVKVTPIHKTSSNVSGYIVNHNEHSLALPLINITFFKNNVAVHSQTYRPKEYLIKSLINIERIPQNSPFNFNIIAPIDKKDFDNYHLEIIRP